MGCRKRRACEAQVSSIQMHIPSLHTKRTKSGDTSWSVVYAGGDTDGDLCAENVLSVRSMWLKEKDSNSETKHKLFYLPAEQSNMAKGITFQPGATAGNDSFAERRYARRRSRNRRELKTTAGGQEDVVCCGQKQDRFEQMDPDSYKYSLPGQTSKNSSNCSGDGSKTDKDSIIINSSSGEVSSRFDKDQVTSGDSLYKCEKAKKFAIYDIYETYATASNTDNTKSVSASGDSLGSRKTSHNKSLDIYESYETYSESSNTDNTKSTLPVNNKYYQRERRFPLAEGLYKRIISKKLRKIGVETWWPRPIHIAWLIGGGYIAQDEDYDDLSLDDEWNDAEDDDNDNMTEEISTKSVSIIYDNCQLQRQFTEYRNTDSILEVSSEHYSETQSSVDIGRQCEKASNNHSTLSSNQNKYSISLSHDDSGYESAEDDESDTDVKVAEDSTCQNTWEKLFDICLDMLSKLRF